MICKHKKTYRYYERVRTSDQPLTDIFCYDTPMMIKIDKTYWELDDEQRALVDKKSQPCSICKQQFPKESE